MPKKQKEQKKKISNMGPWGKVFLAGAAYAIIGMIIHMIEAAYTMDYYTNPIYFPLWSLMMMPTAGAPPMDFFITSLAFGLFTGMLIAYVYLVVKDSIPEKNLWVKGAKYGWLLFLVAGIPMFLSLYLLLSIPFGLIFSWLASGFIIYLAGGAAMGRIVGQ
ncbi:MAG: hypothetical protein V1835_04630 [Candidatus Micrarchaeota archaeon]